MQNIKSRNTFGHPLSKWTKVFPKSTRIADDEFLKLPLNRNTIKILERHHSCHYSCNLINLRKPLGAVITDSEYMFCL